MSQRVDQAIRAARGDESQQVFATRVGCSIAQLQRWEAPDTDSHPTRYDHVEALVREGVERTVLTGALAAKGRGGRAA